MINNTPARIYKAAQRGLFENNTQRWEATFSFEQYQDTDRLPFGTLKVVNDETLAPGKSITRHNNTGTVLLIPLVGALEYTRNGKMDYTETNEATWLPAQGEIMLRNPYENELINFLYILFEDRIVSEPTTISINLEERSKLTPFSLPGAVKAKMGLFNGRAEAIYKLSATNNGLFIFIISGAFEVQGRLLEARDGLALWQLEEADMEALSENALVLILEVPMGS